MVNLAGIGQKLFYLLFVFWVGGIAPLTYFNVFATDHFLPPYQVAGISRPPQLRLHLPAAMSTRINDRLMQKFASHADGLSARNRLPIITFLFQHSTDLPYLRKSEAGRIISIYLGRLCLCETPVDRSTPLRPPEKPPRFLV